MKYPLVGLCIAFCLGIITAAYLKIPFLVFCLLTFLSLIFSILFLKQNTKFSILLLCAIFSLGATLLRNSQILSNCHIAKLIPYKSDSVSLIGVIDNDPTYQNRRVSFILKVEKLKINPVRDIFIPSNHPVASNGVNEDWVKTRGKVLVNVFSAKGARLPDGQGSALGGKKNDFTYGDRLFLSGNLYRPFSFSKGEFNYRDYLRHQGIYLIFSVKKGSIVKQLDKNVGNPIKSFAFRIRHKMRDVIVKNLSPFSAGILNAIILGERQNLPVYVRDVLAKSGTVHILATQCTKNPSSAL